jgi:penicillin-binding protein 1C
MWNVSGITGAAPVWLEIMNRLHRSSGSVHPQPPSGVTAKKIEFRDGMEPPRYEWFIEGTEPAHLMASGTPGILNTKYETPHIIYPSDGTVIAIDPDIPKESDVLFFEAENGSGEFSWILNNEEIGASRDMVAWSPNPGKYRLSLVDKENQVVNSVKFEVRGSGPAE